MSDDATEGDVITGETRREGPGSRPAAPRDRLARGTAVGRYLILDVLGAGGMGVVYSAFDPELDRKVAIKLLQARIADAEPGDQTWLLREAQAMARLSHPNVIAVHDVGTLPGDRVFIAMEYVDGLSLRHWLKRERRPWREVLPILRAAGDGLAAAHAAGLVHRDFKPDNVLVGADHRVRVLDFGLARLHGEPPSSTDVPPVAAHQVSLRSPLSESLTTAGTVVGTPEYMAPELAGGGAADAKSDQFAFAVALYEALYRRRPFAGGDRRAPLTPPSDSEVPAAVTRVVLRGLAHDPGERYPTIDALLRELTVDNGRRRRVAIGAAVAALVAAGVGVGALMTRRGTAAPTPTPVPCTGIEARLTGVWDDASRDAVHRAFVASGKPFAATAATALERALDAYAQTWITTATDSCVATRVRGEQTEEAMGLREVCLDQRLGELRALTRLVVDPDDLIVGKGDQLAAGLEPVSRCSDLAALRAPMRPPPEATAEVAKINATLASSKAELLAGHLVDASRLAREVSALADQIRYPVPKADARLVEGAALAGLGLSERAAAAFADATYAGLAANRPDVAAAAAQAAATNALAQRLGEARIWIGVARALASRIPADDATAQRQLEVEGLIAGASGDLPAAVTALEQALAAAERRFGRDSPMLWHQEELLGVTYAKTGAYDRARPHYERALHLRRQSVGDEHPDIAVLLTNLGPCYMHAGDEAKARAVYQQALAVRERLEGARSPMLILTLNNMADGLIRAGDGVGAVIYADRGWELAAEVLGTRDPMFHAISTTRAEALAAAGRTADARAAYDAVVALETATDSSVLGPTLSSRGSFELAQGEWRRARDTETRAIAAIERSRGPDSAELLAPLTGLARAELKLGRPERARPLLERALAVGERGRVSAADLEPTRALLREATRR